MCVCVINSCFRDFGKGVSAPGGVSVSSGVSNFRGVLAFMGVSILGGVLALVAVSILRRVCGLWWRQVIVLYGGNLNQPTLRFSLGVP